MVMKLSIFVMLFFAILISSSEASDTDLNLNHTDKQLHLAVSAAGTIFLDKVFKESGIKNHKLAAAITMLFIGASKELLDRPGSVGDMKANVVGVGLGTAINIAF